MTASGKHRILIADDNRDAADTLATVLELSGFEVAVAYDGAQAVARARSFLPAAVILDINMPTMDGYQAARVIRKSKDAGDRTILIALTARSTDDDLRAAGAAGFDMHLVKPVGGDDLVSLLERVLAEDPPDRRFLGIKV